MKYIVNLVNTRGVNKVKYIEGVDIKKKKKLSICPLDLIYPY